jgi:hypothetical protein
MATVSDLSDADIANIKARIARHEKYAEIASDYRLNQGRIADIKFGRIRPDIEPAQLALDETPPAFLQGTSRQPTLF